MVVVGIVVSACSGSGPQASPASGGVGTGFLGDGVQCGAIFCSGSQQCCLVSVAVDASAAGPTHKCDQGCESQCLDACPDAGADMPGMGGMPPMNGMGPDGGMPMKGPGTDAMAGAAPDATAPAMPDAAPHP